MTRKKGYITRQAKRLSTGEINRRRFVMQALSAGVTMPTAMSLASRAEAAQPRKGGILRQAVARLDLPYGAGFVTGNALTEVAPDGTIRGELATRIIATPSVWTFVLRENVSFHTGKPLSPDDVMASFAFFRQAHPDHEISTNITRMEASGDHIRFHLRHPDKTFAARLAQPELAIRPLDDAGVLDHAVGTGPYVLQDAEPNRARFTRNPDYWKPQTAHFDAVELIAMPDAKTRQNAILNGEIDVAEGIDPRSVALLHRAPHLGIVERENTDVLGVALCRAGTPQLAAAVSALMPRQALVDKVLLGHGRPSAAQQDLAAAKAIFDMARHVGPIVLAATETDYAGARDTARLLATEARKIGVDIQITDRPEGAHLRTARLSDGNDPLAAMIPNAILAHTATLANLDVLQRDPNRLAENGWFV